MSTVAGGGHANRKRSLAKTFLWRGIATTRNFWLQKNWIEGVWGPTRKIFRRAARQKIFDEQPAEWHRWSQH